MTETCADCGDDELVHCHAAWVRHADGHEECLVISCRSGPDAHELLVLCRDVDADCCA